MEQLKIFYLDQDTRENWVKYEEDGILRFCWGMDILQIFPDENRFILTENPHEAEAVVFDLKNNSVSAEILIHKIQSFIDNFPNCKLIYELNNLFHMGIGCSNTDNYSKMNQLYQHVFQDKNIPPILSLHTSIDAKQDKSHVYYTDFLFNRQYALYVDQPDRIFEADLFYNQSNHWYPKTQTGKLDKNLYKLNNIDRAIDNVAFNNNAVFKSYLSANRVRNPDIYFSEYGVYQNFLDELDERFSFRKNTLPPLARDFLRTELIKMLRDYPGYLGDPGRGNVLPPECCAPEIMREVLSYTGYMGYVPVNSVLYDTSVLSIGVETNIHEQHFGSALTEKTLEPFLKGHIPLFYSNPKFYSKCVKQHYGFEMPEWVNLDLFDNEEQHIDRWMYFLLEVKRILNLGPNKLLKLREESREILHHNRQICVSGYRKSLWDCTKHFYENIGRHYTPKVL